MKHEKLLLKTNPPTGLQPDFRGVWKNQLGSKMDLTVKGQSISGTYISAVSGAGGPVTGDLVGFINGDLISFVVNWPSAAITAWVGQMVNDNGDDVIETLWQLTTNIPDASEPTNMWQAIYAGTDRFHR